MKDDSLCPLDLNIPILGTLKGQSMTSQPEVFMTPHILGDLELRDYLCVS